MEALRVAILTDMCSPRFGGGYQDRYWNLARHLVRLGHSVTVYTAQESAVGNDQGVRFCRALPPAFLPDRTGSRTLPFSALFASTMAVAPTWTEPPDVLLTEAIPYAQLPLMGRWARSLPALRLLNVNEAWTGYSYFPGLLSSPSRALVKACLRSAVSWNDEVLAISEVTARSLRENFGATRPTVVPMGLDVSDFLERQARSPPRGPYDVVSVGRLVRIKRHADLLRGLALLRERCGWSGKAAIIGSGVLREDLERLRDRSGLSEQVDLLGGVSDQEKLGVLRDAKVFALCSEREGFSLASLEAALSGLALVVARPPQPEVFGASDLVSDGKEGLYYPLGDVPALAERLHRLLEDSGLRVRLGAQARLHAESYDWSRIAALLSARLREISRSSRS